MAVPGGSFGAPAVRWQPSACRADYRESSAPSWVNRLRWQRVSIDRGGGPYSITFEKVSRRSQKSLDFGHGWNGGCEQHQVQESRRLGYGWQVHR